MEQTSPDATAGPRRLPYVKPEFRVIDIGNMLDALEKAEGESYRRFTELCENVEALIQEVESINGALVQASESLDRIRADYGRAQAILDTVTSARKEVEGGPVPSEG